MKRHLKLSVLSAVLVGSFGIAHAGSINASYTAPYGFGTATYTTNLPGHVGGRSDSAGQMNGVRIDAPGPGVDTLVPFQFPTYCVEIGETINIPANNFHPDVLPLLGSTTTGGGISGPVLFDALRTYKLQGLWAIAYGSVVNQTTSMAFQLAQWEIAFDNDTTLVQQTGAKLYVTAPEFQAGVTDLAESWLTTIRDSESLPQTQLVLLRGQGIQDLVTPANPVPEPATMAVLGLGVAALARRRKARKS